MRPDEITFEVLYGVSSPWAFLGAPEAERISKRFGVKLRLRPILVIEENGGIPLRTRPLPRQAYHALDLARFSSFLSIPLVAKPQYYPVSDIRVPATSIVRLQLVLARTLSLSLEDAQAHESVLKYSYVVQRALWVEERDVGSVETLRELMLGAGVGEEVVQAVFDEADESLFEAGANGFKNNLAHATQLDVFGTPTYVVNGELFWGQDRLAFVERRIEELLGAGEDRSEAVKL